MVTLIVRGTPFELSEDWAALIVYGLDARATELGALERAIGLRLIGERSDAIDVDDAQAVALFRFLDDSGHGSPDSELRPLYQAVREIHDQEA